MELEEFYQHAELKENPFRQNEDQEDDPRSGIWVGYDDQKTVLVRFLEKCTREDGRSHFIMLYGTWGTGKSHALLWARHQIVHAQAGNFQSVAYYIRTLKVEDKLSFGQAINHFVVNRSRFLRDVLNFGQWLKERIAEFKTENHLGADFTYEDAVARLYSNVEQVTIARHILHCQSHEDIISKLELAKSKDYKVMSTFATTMKLFTSPLRINGSNVRFKKAAYLFIDELDDLDRASVKERQNTNDLLRDFYDMLPKNFCLVGGLSISASDLESIFPAYVLERVRKKIVMSHFRAHDAKDFVQQLIELHRVDGASHTGFYPFDELAVDAVINRLPEELMTPRRIIEIFYEILEGTRDAGFDFTDPLVTLDYLEDNDIIEDALEG